MKQLLDFARRAKMIAGISSGRAAMSRQPIVIARPPGVCPDDMDTLGMTDGFEDPKQWEATILQAFKDAETDADLADVLGYAHLQQDRAASFARFFNSPVPLAIKKLLDRLNVHRDAAIADVGCGPGHMAHAMSRLGYRNLTAMDPNEQWFTGTGYLKSLRDHDISIVNDLARWRGMCGRYDAVISSGTVHHWQHIPQVAVDTRRVMRPGAYWLMISEFIANSPRELVANLKGHPTATRYHSYEWPYPASAYVDLVQSVGLNLVAVIPHYYNNNEFLGWSLPVPPELPPDFSRQVDDALLAPGGTVDAFWDEVDAFRRKDEGWRYFTSPQVFVFQRVGI
jgi:2-polyprenyl-3-methyl-5-hydroxy-6-metoxy-1,4-benzoquinol methylase